MAKKRLEILTDVDRTAINKRIDDISTEYVFGFEETFVATANQVEFVLSKEFDKGMQAVELYINGVKQPSSFFTEVNNTTIKTKKPIAQGDIVNIKAYKSKKTIEIKTTAHKDSHISGDDQLPVATDSTKGLMAPEDKKKIKAVEIKANSALEKVAEHDTEIDNLKQSVSDGKKKVSVAITDKGVETAPDATFDTMATNISKIETDPSIGTTDAIAGDLLEGKTAVSQGEHITGTMVSNGNLNKIITTQNGKQIITPGYYEGGEVKAQFNNLVADNIKKGINVGGIIGNYESTVTFKTVDLPKDTFYLNNGESKEKFIPMDWGGVPVALSAGLIVGRYDSDYDETYQTDHWIYPENYGFMRATKYYYVDGSRKAETSVKITLEGIELSAKTSSPAKYYGIIKGWVLVLTSPKYE